MKITRYVVLLSLIALLLTSCVGLPPMFPSQGASTQGAEGTGAAVAATEPAAQPVEQATAAPAPAVSETEVVTATVAAPAATIAATDVVTGTAPVETPATPTADQVMGANPLVGVVWEWAAVLKTKPAVQSVVPDPTAYTIAFSDDGIVAIKADCNNASGTYTLDNDALTIKIGPVTRAACPPGSLSDLMLASLSKVGSYLIDGGDLILRAPDTGDSMLFRNGGPSAAPAAPAAPTATEAPAGAAAPAPAQTPTAVAPAEVTAPKLVGTVWQWEQFVDVATGKASMDIKDPTQYTITFMDDGSAEMKADCNNAAGTYTVDGAKMTINVGPVTLAACAPDSQSETFLIDLTSVATYNIENGKLNLDLMADGGRMILGTAK